LPIPFGMRALGMTRQIRDGRLERGIESSHVPALQGLDNVASNMHGTHGHLACRHRHRGEELRHRGQKPFERRRRNRGPHQPLDEGRFFGVKGMQIGVRFPRLKQSCYLPAPLIGPTDHLEALAGGWEVRQQVTEAVRLRVPTDDQPQDQGLSVHLPPDHECDPLAFGECGVDGLQRLGAQRAQAFAVFAKRLHDVGMHPSFGPDEQDATLSLHAAQRVHIDGAAIRKHPTASQCGWLGPERLCIGCIRGQNHHRRGIAQQVHRRRECDRGGLDHCEAPGKDLTQTVMDSKRAAILQDKGAKRGKRAAWRASEDFARHVPNEPRGHGAGDIGQVGLGHLVIQGLVGDGGAPEGLEAAVDIGNRLDPLAGTGCCQCQAQAKRRDDALASTKRHVFATGIEQWFGKHPLARVSDHAQVSVIHLGLLSLSFKQHGQEEFRMDRHRNPQQNQILKSTYL